LPGTGHLIAFALVSLGMVRFLMGTVLAGRAVRMASEERW